MMNNTAIKIENLSKVYKLYDNPIDSLKEALHPFRKKYHRDFYALRDISFEVKKGDNLGIVGRNGAGKSTLLKILTRVLTPSSGNLTVNGKVSSLLELGTGFNPEFTGIENIYFSSTIMGYSKEEIDNKLDDIISFADIGNFINQPVKTYSSGMYVRVAFAVAINVDPDILIVDEALSVGDAYFQFKCMNKMKSLIASGKTLIFVSHDPTAIKTICKSAILLDNGRIIDRGEPKEVIDFYNGLILKDTHQGDSELRLEKLKKLQLEIKDNNKKEQSIITATNTDKKEVSKDNDIIDDSSRNIFTGEVELISVKVFNELDKAISYTESEKIVKVIYEIKSLKSLVDPHYGIIIRDRFGNSAFETNTYCMGIKPGPLKKGNIVKVIYEFEFNLIPGTYSISIGVANKGYSIGSFEENLLLVHDVEVIKVIENSDAIRYGGYYNMKPSVIIK